MLKSLRLICFLFLAHLAFSQSTSPKYHVVKYYADWCSSCQTLKPVYKEVKEELNGESILFSTLDLTNDKTKNQATLLLTAMKKESLLDKKTKTGWILVQDYKTGEYITHFTAKDDTKAIVKKLKSLL